MKIQKKIFWGGGGGWGSVGVRGQSGCERRIEVFVKIQKKNFLGGSGGGGGGGGGGGRAVGVGLGGQSGCERRIEVFVKIQKKDFSFLRGGGGGVRGGGVGRGSGSGVRVDVNKELKFL